MKKLFTIASIMVLLISATGLHAQTFEKGDGVLNLTIGLGNALYTGGGYNSSIPPIAASYEIGVKNDIIDENGSIGVGGYVGYASYKYRYTLQGSNWGFNYTSFIIGPRGTFHYQLFDKLDTYAGLLIGANILSSRSTGNVDVSYGASTGGVIFDSFLGARYYFNDKVAATAEIGFGVAYLNLGASFKLK